VTSKPFRSSTPTSFKRGLDAKHSGTVLKGASVHAKGGRVASKSGDKVIASEIMVEIVERERSPSKRVGLPSQVGALRALAKKVETTGAELPAKLTEEIIEALEDREDLEAVRDARERLANGEKTIEASEVFRKLGL